MAEEISPLFINRFETGFYDDAANNIVEMGTTSLAGADYKHSFNRVIEQWSNNYLYRNNDGTEFRTNIVGEICAEELGTLLGAKGNHYPGKAGQQFRPITDESKVKNVVVLKVPTYCTPFMLVVYQNQIGTLNSIREADEEEEHNLALNYSVREWIKGSLADPNMPHDLIVLHTQPIYVNPNKNMSASTPMRIGKRSLKDVSSTPGKSELHKEVAVDEGKPSGVDGMDIKLGAFYDPHLMPDYGGPFFNHTINKLTQLDIVDEEDQLIPPWKMYNALRPGTLILANCSLHCFLMADVKVQRKLYQINIHSIKVIGTSDRKVVMPARPTVPRPVVGSSNSESVTTAGASSDQVSAQSVATDAFTKFSTAKKRRLSSSGAAPVDAPSEKKRKGKAKQSKASKDAGEDLMDVTPQA